MIDWIIDNSFWVFSGIGVAAVTAIAMWVKGLYSRHQRSMRQTPEFDPRGYAATPDPRTIVDDIRDSPPYQEEDKKKHYVGQKVYWTTTFEEAHRIRRGRARLMLLDRGGYPWISCTVVTNEYPRLKLIRRGSTVSVIGEISDIHAKSIFLVNVRLKFNNG